jgi:hypothetical protein
MGSDKSFHKFPGIFWEHKIVEVLGASADFSDFGNVQGIYVYAKSGTPVFMLSCWMTYTTFDYAEQMHKPC